MKASDTWPPSPPAFGGEVVITSEGAGNMSEKKQQQQQQGEGSVLDSAGSARQGELQRQLSGRHLNFIAIGGTIGTGFFLGTGTALVKAGPAGTLISYVFVGTILWCVMVCLGEMATYIPTAGSFSAYATRFVDPSLGFAVGWLYWFSCECVSFFFFAWCSCLDGIRRLYISVSLLFLSLSVCVCQCVRMRGHCVGVAWVCVFVIWVYLYLSRWVG